MPVAYIASDCSVREMKNWNGTIVNRKLRAAGIMLSFLCAASLFLIGLSVASQEEIDEVCSDDVMCIRTVQQDRFVRFYAINKKPALPLTGVVTLELSNMKRRDGNLELFVLEGSEERYLFTLAAGDRGAWRYNYQFRWTRGDFRARHDNNVIYRLPYGTGTKHRVMQGCNSPFSHAGPHRNAVDFGMPENTPIYAARGGVVADLKEDSNRGGPNRNFLDDGNYVVILHEDRTVALYYHLQKDGVPVEIGDRVDAGDLIGFSGNTGFSTGPHLHFEVTRALPQVEGDDSIPVVFEAKDRAVACPEAGDVLTAR